MKPNDFLLRALNTSGEGVRKLQLFTKDGKLKEEQRMHNDPFRIESWTADTVTVKYLVGDLRLFLPWSRVALVVNRKSENGIWIGSRYTIERRLAKQLMEAIITDKI